MKKNKPQNKKCAFMHQTSKTKTNNLAFILERRYVSIFRNDQRIKISSVGGKKKHQKTKTKPDIFSQLFKLGRICAVG